QTYMPALDDEIDDAAGPSSPAVSSAPSTPTIQSAAPPDMPAPAPARADRAEMLKSGATLYDRIEAFISRLSVRDNFWRSVCSFIWLPLAFFSGLKMKEIDPETFAAILPFRRFNRNWYRAMAGWAVLANSEIAGGGDVFGNR